MSTKTAVTTRTGIKFYFWVGLGELVAYAVTAIPLLSLPPNWEPYKPLIGIVLGGIGKMIASYLATENNL